MDRFSEETAADMQRNYRLHLAGQGESAPQPEPLTCGGCGRAVNELFECYWEPTIQVGACCLVHSDQEPLCPAALGIVLGSTSVQQLANDLGVHLKHCRTCGTEPVKISPKPARTAEAANKEKAGAA